MPGYWGNGPMSEQDPQIWQDKHAGKTPPLLTRALLPLFHCQKSDAGSLVFTRHQALSSGTRQSAPMPPKFATEGNVAMQVLADQMT